MSTQHDSRPLKWHYTELDDRDLEIRGRTLFFVIVLFSIILLITVLFLYTRWICRYHGSRHSSAASAAVFSIHAHHAPPQSRGLDPASIKKLPIILHQAPSNAEGGAWEDTECCICLGEFVDGEKLKVLPGCEHCFHCDCVDKWLTHHSSCPLCRASLLKIETSFPNILIEEPPIRIDIQF